MRPADETRPAGAVEEIQPARPSRDRKPAVAAGADALPAARDGRMADIGGPWQRARAGLKRLSTRSRFWHSALTMVFMPAVWRSGIRLRLTPDHFEAVLPFTRQNRNYDGHMAGAALLGSCEVAAGGYVFHQAEGQFLVVCKALSYSFRRPCTAAAEYRVALHPGLPALIAAGRSFTVDLTVEVFERDDRGAVRHRIGTAEATFHARPLTHERRRRRAA